MIGVRIYFEGRANRIYKALDKGHEKKAGVQNDF